MNRLIFIFILGSLMSKGYAAPMNSQTAGDFEEDHELIGGFFQGDMDIEMTRNGLISEARHWPDGIVHYYIDKVFDKDHIAYIKSAMNAIEAVSCIRFKPAKYSTRAYIYFTGYSSGCYSAVGYRRRRQQITNLQMDPLNRGCFRLGTIQHEILHALGFYHQQSASNRDDYVLIVKENIQNGAEHNFDKYGNNIVTDFGVEYDYGSIMHYPAYAFSKNGYRTIIPLKGKNIEIGQRRGLSSSDIKKLNLMYKCPSNAITTP